MPEAALSRARRAGVVSPKAIVLSIVSHRGHVGHLIRDARGRLFILGAGKACGESGIVSAPAILFRLAWSEGSGRVPVVLRVHRKLYRFPSVLWLESGEPLLSICISLRSGELLTE